MSSYFYSVDVIGERLVDRVALELSGVISFFCSSYFWGVGLGFSGVIEANVAFVTLVVTAAIEEKILPFDYE